MLVTSGHHTQSLTCYPPRQVIGGLDGRLLVVDAEVHHVDVTVAGAGGRGRQQALQNQVSILNLRLFKCRIGRRQTELRDLWSQVRDLMSRVLLSPEEREGGLTGGPGAGSVTSKAYQTFIFCSNYNNICYQSCCKRWLM